ncbi:MAG: hypothetical protein JXR70_09715 [Spirochaetales bacterium]|nr:hypothetical protein [Spirochaetales bacterium]
MKKSKWFILLLLLFCFGQIFAAECGDVDSNGTINIVDSLLVAKKYVGMEVGAFDSSVADVNNNNVVDIVDALLIAQFYVKLPNAVLNCAQEATPTEYITPTPVETSVPGSYDCSSIQIWSASAQYPTTGTKVVYNGKVYQSNWYANGENPEQNNGTGKVWTLLGSCDPNLTPPPVATAPPMIVTGSRGYATRFWDCCKPHCSWSANVPAGMEPLKTCNIDGQTWNTDVDAKSSCEGGPSYVCYDLIPFEVDEYLSYGFAATSSGDICGKCFEVQFTGEGHYSNTPGAVALKGKRMILMAVNIGYDVSGGQFDILIPGGGVGAFNGCSTQWNVSNSQMGATYGGLLTACMEQYGYYDHAALKSCLREKNESIFKARGLTQLAEGLDWFINWYEAADNPNLIYRETTCPQQLIDISGLKRP